MNNAKPGGQVATPEPVSGEAATPAKFNPRHFLAVLSARNREFLRDRSSWMWNLVFPVLLIVGLAVLFGNEDRALYKIGVYPGTAENMGIFDLRHVSFVETATLEEGIQLVERHQLDMLIEPASRKYWINDTSASGYIAERLLLGSDNNNDSDSGAFNRELVSGDEVRYVDWVLPGVLGMNMMFTCLFGVGYVVVRYRKSGVLKRLRATPLQALEFLTAQVVSRLWLVLATTLVIFVGTNLLLKFTMHGSYLTLALVMAIGAFSLITLGLLVAAQTASEELAGGLLNLFTWPMMMLSGVWFSLEGAHPFVQAIAKLLPLTHLVDAARAVMIDGASLLDIGWHVAFLLVFAAACLVLGAKLFHWE